MATTIEDLEWWLTTARRLPWKWASTFASSAPHWYVVHDMPGLRRREYLRAARIIHTFGQPGKYNGWTNIYLTDPVTGMKWWTMDEPLERVRLINQAEAAAVYGPQDAQSTETGRFTEWDAIACEWPKMRDPSQDDGVRERIIGRFGAYAPKTLDVGCGTGALLDLGVVAPALYTGVDPSRAMLNRLLRVHPSAGRVVPAALSEADLDDGYELVVAMGMADILTDAEQSRLGELCSGLLIIT